MRNIWPFIFFVAFYLQGIECKKEKHPKPYKQRSPSSKYDNPGQVRDRLKHLEEKAYEKSKGSGHVGANRPSVMGDKWSNRFTQPYHPAWMDYCDPYHCNDYHKRACGLNREKGKFKWFQSGCHIAINNICTTYKGTLKYDMIEPKFCTQYVMHLRTQCPEECGEELDPVCGISSFDNHVVLFKNLCSFERANCQQEPLNEYEVGDMDICRYTYTNAKVKRG